MSFTENICVIIKPFFLRKPHFYKKQLKLFPFVQLGCRLILQLFLLSLIIYRLFNLMYSIIFTFFSLFVLLQGTTVWPQKNYLINGKTNFVPTQYSSNIKTEIEENFLSRFFTYCHLHPNHLLYLLPQQPNHQLQQEEKLSENLRNFHSTNHQIENCSVLIRDVQPSKSKNFLSLQYLLKPTQKFYHFKDIDGNLLLGAALVNMMILLNR